MAATIHIQWNLSTMALQIKDTPVIQMTIDGPKRSAIKMCTYLTSELGHLSILYYGRLIRSQTVILHG